MRFTSARRTPSMLITRCGPLELACMCCEDYEATAIALLDDAPRLQKLRSHLEEGRAGFPLFDGARFARDLEALFERMLERERRGLSPDHLAADAAG